jgi:hypothetical protein
MPTPRAIALARAAELAADTASRSHDTRHALEALALKREAEVELDRIPGVTPRISRTHKAWGRDR